MSLSGFVFPNPCYTDKMMQSGRITPVRAPPVIFPRVAKRTMRRESEIRCCERQYPTSFCNQLFVLLKRNFLIILRDRTLTYSRLITHICIGFFIGILYYDIGGDASNILNNFNYLFFSVIFLQFTAFNSVTTTCKWFYRFLIPIKHLVCLQFPRNYQ